jgi:hypothetical protein
MTAETADTWLLKNMERGYWTDRAGLLASSPFPHVEVLDAAERLELLQKVMRFGGVKAVMWKRPSS